MRVSVEKPGSPAEVLEHTGVKGMKWGVRKAQESRRTSRDFEKRFPTVNSRRREIERARGSVKKLEKQIDKEKDPKKQQQLAKAFGKNQDRITALRTTRGEKVVSGILAYMLTGPTLVVPAAVGGYSVARTVKRKRLEKEMGV